MPYAPGNWGVYGQGLANLAGGISEGASGVAAGIKDYAAQSKLTRSLRTMFQTVDPENKDMYDTMGLPQLQGKLQSYAVQHTINMVNEGKQRMRQEAALGEALKRYGEGPQLLDTPAAGPAPASDFLPEVQGRPTLEQSEGVGTSGPSGISREQRIRYALQTPGLGGSGAVRLLSALQEYHNLRSENLLPMGASVPVGDYGAIVGTGTANHFVPAGSRASHQQFFNRDDLETAAEVKGAPGWKRITTGPNASQLVYVAGQAPEAVAIMDSEGAPTGQLAYFDGKSGKWVKMDDPNYSGPALRVIDEEGNLVPNVLYHPKAKKVIDLRSQLEKALGETAPKPAEKPKAEPPKKGLYDDFKDWLKTRK